MEFMYEGLSLLKKFEGCKLTAYRDGGGILTIGYGHTHGVIEGMVITQEQADKYLIEDIDSTQNDVSSMIHPSANENQFSAAVCFAFNVRGYSHTALFVLLIHGDFEEAKNHWLLYNKITIDGKKIESNGLKNRRQAELNLFCKPVGLS